tara:strand:- start:1573 stop:1851 length:279 start_codon:yes stop_codon:yes gene_type:complete
MTKDLKQEIGQLLLMCFNANSFEDYDVFFNYSGHVDAIDLRISKPELDDPIFSETLYIKGSLYRKEEFKKEVKKWRKELMKILNPVIALSEA